MTLDTKIALALAAYIFALFTLITLRVVYLAGTGYYSL